MAKVADINFANAKDLVTADALTFARYGIAINRDGSEAADGVMRKDIVPITTPVEATAVTGYLAFAANEAGIWARSTADQKQLFFSANGTSWALKHTALNSIRSAFLTSQGTLLIAVNKIEATDDAGTLWRKPVGSNTFTKVIDHDVMEADANIDRWGFSEAAGTLYVVGYRTLTEATNARNVFKSDDDGLTWIQITNSDNVTSQHIHTVVGCVVGGVRRAYTAHGDIDKWGIKRATDNGTTTWTRVDLDGASLPSVAIQPTCGVWIPEKNAIVWGSDGAKMGGLLYHDLSDDSIIPLLDVTATVNDGSESGSSTSRIPYFFGMMNIGGRYFTAAADSGAGATNKNGGIWMSADGTNWQRILALANITLSDIAGVGSDGNLWVRDTAQSYKMPIPEKTLVSGALIEREARNQFHATKTPAGDAGTTVDAAYDTGIWHGYNGAAYDKATRWTSDAAVTADKGINFAQTTQVIQNVAENEILVWALRLKGTVGTAGDNLGTGLLKKVEVRAIVADNDGANLTRSRAAVFADKPTWFPVVGYIKSRAAITGGLARCDFRAEVKASANPQDADFDLAFDGITYESAICPAEYHKAKGYSIESFTDVAAGVTLKFRTTTAHDLQNGDRVRISGGTPYDGLHTVTRLDDRECSFPGTYSATATGSVLLVRPQEVLSYTPAAFPAAFTDIFTVASRFADYEMHAAASGDAVSYIYLRSYAVDADNFIAIVYDVSDKKVKLVNEVAGVNTVIASTDAIYLMRDEAITVAVTRSGTAATLTVLAGGVLETDDGTITDHTIVTSYWGCHPAGTQGGSLVFVRDVMFDSVITDIEDEMQWPKPVVFSPTVSVGSSDIPTLLGSGGLLG